MLLGVSCSGVEVPSMTCCNKMFLCGMWFYSKKVYICSVGKINGYALEEKSDICAGCSALCVGNTELFNDLWQ